VSQCGSQEKLASVALYDACGLLVARHDNLEVSKYSFNTNNLSPGCYNAKIETESGHMYTQKIIVQ
jgi:Secretion system C-terminal sorting domain